MEIKQKILQFFPKLWGLIIHDALTEMLCYVYKKQY